MIVISPATSSDVQFLIQLEEQLFISDRISRRQFLYLINKGNSIVVKAEMDGSFVGYMVLLKRSNSKRLRLYSLAVARQARKQGVAALLLQFAEQAAVVHHCNKLTLEVSWQNDSAIALYRSAGFSQYGIKENYYEDGCTALLFHKKLSSLEKNI